MLKVRCRGHEGSLVSIVPNPNLTATYPDGTTDIKAYDVTLTNDCSDTVIVHSAFPADIEVYNSDF